MRIFDYVTAGGKNLITEYLDKLPKNEKAAGYRIRGQIEAYGIIGLKSIKTRQLKERRNPA